MSTNYIENQVKRISRNRIVLFLLLAAYFSIFVFGAFFGDEDAVIVELLPVGGVPMTIFLLLAIYNMVISKHYTKSKTFKKLGRLGPDSAETVNIEVSREVETAGYIMNRLVFGERWICVEGAFSANVYPCEWLLWAYTLITSTNTGKYYRIVFAFRNGKQVKYKARNQETCTEVLTVAYQKYPHIMIGYSEELSRQYFNEVQTARMRKMN